MKEDGVEHERYVYPRYDGSGKRISIPKTWDWREKNGEDGKPLLFPARDQGDCGSCYAFAAAQMMSHRLSISTNGRSRILFSPQDIVNRGEEFVSDMLNDEDMRPYFDPLFKNHKLAEAEEFFIEGCDGALLSGVVNYLVLHGVATDADEPYTYGNPVQPMHPKGMPRHFAKSSHSLTMKEGWFPQDVVVLEPRVLKEHIENMQLAIMNHGPILAAMTVFSDFPYYPRYGDVYITRDTITIGDIEETVVNSGGHAIVIVGWSETKDDKGRTVPYWICQNSWGTEWGKDGYFYILRGSNANNIELDAVAVMGDQDSAVSARTPTKDELRDMIRRTFRDRFLVEVGETAETDSKSPFAGIDRVLNVVIVSMAAGFLIISLTFGIYFFSKRRCM